MITRGEFEAHKNDPNVHFPDGTLYIDEANSRVGIGTSDPERLLHVHGIDASGELILSGSRPDGLSHTRNAVSFWDLAGQTDPERTHFSITHQGGAVNGQATLRIKSLTSTFDWKNDIMIIAHDGNVSIGVTSPDAKLNIIGGTDAGQDYNNLLLETINNRGWMFTSGKYAHATYGDYPLIIEQQASTYTGDFVIKGHRNTIIENGHVGIGTTGPGYKLDVSGDIHCTGKLTSDGGNDPAYVLYDYQTRKSLIELVKKEVPPSKLGGAVLFFNGERQSLELFLPLKGEFRSLGGELLEKVDPITKTFEVEKKYYFDEEDGEVKSYEVKKNPKKYRLKEGVTLDSETGKFKKVVKRKVKKIIDGREEMVEVEEEIEITKEEAIEEAQETV